MAHEEGATNFGLEWSAEVPNTGPWTKAAQCPAMVNGRRVLSLPIETDNKLFRLRVPE